MKNRMKLYVIHHLEIVTSSCYQLLQNEIVFWHTFWLFTALLMFQTPLVMSLSGTFKRYEIQHAVSELTSIADVRTEADCPLMCMRYPFCYGFALDKKQSKCYLLGCGNHGNKFSTLPVYMYTVNTLLARGRNMYLSKKHCLLFCNQVWMTIFIIA